MLPDPVRPGDVIAGGYRIGALVGTGSMGSVYAASHVGSGELVAVKVLHARYLREAEVLDRFVREARVAARLASPHAVRVHDVGMLPEGVPFFVMEHLQGVDLQRHVQHAGPLPSDRAVSYLLQACEAVAEAHDLGVVHRDLKPANLFLSHAEDGRDRIKVIDFGVSKLLKPLDGDGDATATTMVVGTPAFMAPEQMRSAKVDARADIWALGVTLFWLLTGKRPFMGEGIVKIYESILRGPPSLMAMRPELPAALEEVVKRTLVWNPEQRLGSVRELMQELAPFARPQPAGAMEDRDLEPPPSTELIDPAVIALPDPPPRRFTFDRRRAWRAGAGVAIAALAVGSYALGTTQRQESVTTVAVFAPAVAIAADIAATLARATPPDPPPLSDESAPDEGAARPLRAQPRPAPLRPPPKPTKSDQVWGMP
jgi:serine/threonine-protein kinase